MKILSASLHGVLDFITVFIFVIAPFIFPLSQTAAIICWVLAAVHLLMTIFTGFSMGVVKIISFSLHGIVELIVGLVLVIVPWLVHFLNHADRLFFSIMGVIILLVWLLTNYKSPLRE